MLIYQKQSLPVQLLKFGVDNNGLIVPMLRRGKSAPLRPTLLFRRLQQCWKGILRTR